MYFQLYAPYSFESRYKSIFVDTSLHSQPSTLPAWFFLSSIAVVWLTLKITLHLDLTYYFLRGFGVLTIPPLVIQNLLNLSLTMSSCTIIQLIIVKLFIRADHLLENLLITCLCKQQYLFLIWCEYNEICITILSFANDSLVTHLEGSRQL